MLRDTLRARLMPKGGQRGWFPEAPEAEIHQSRTPKTTKPRRGGAERGV